jgi:RNA polymerase sigma-70 factor (ECF subfamily)
MDEEALRAELEKHHHEGYLWALNCCSQNPAAAEDVLQKAYLKILTGRARFRGEANFKTWLLALIRNTAIDQWRQESRREKKLSSYEEAVGASSDIDQPDELLARGQLHTALIDALSTLSDRQQEIMRLVFYHDLSLSEAAEILGISVGTARTHYERGKDQLRKLLETAKVIDGPELGKQN